MEWLISIFLGIGLAAAVGFRIFLPFLLLSLAHRLGIMDLSSGFQWIGSTPALVLFATATMLEIFAYYIPWFDNLLDTIITPLAMICGSLVMASAMIEMEPWIKWTLAVIAGGGTAGLIKGTSAVSRVISSTTTAGLGNPLLATAEAGGSFSLTLLAIFLPLVAALLVFLLVGYIWVKVFGRKKKAPGSTTVP